MSLFGPPNVSKLAAKKNGKGLIKALRYKRGSYGSGFARIRQSAARALGDIADPAATEALTLALRYDIDDMVRIRSAQALGKIRDERSIEALRAAGTDRNSTVQADAERALEAMGKQTGQAQPTTNTDLEESPPDELVAVTGWNCPRCNENEVFPMAAGEFFGFCGNCGSPVRKRDVHGRNMIPVGDAGQGERKTDRTHSVPKGNIRLGREPAHDRSADIDVAPTTLAPVKDTPPGLERDEAGLVEASNPTSSNAGTSNQELGEPGEKDAGPGGFRSDGKPRAPTDSINWQTVHVFISSTFNDMHAERDLLVKQVFPELRDWCERRKLRLVDVDLRWGVTEEDASRHNNVVQVCFGRIDECRPFFICLLGQRYGWVPRPSDVSQQTYEWFDGLWNQVCLGTSVTELEILHALVRPFHADDVPDDVHHRPVEHAFFYLRDPKFLRAIPAVPSQLRRTFSDEFESNPDGKAFLQQRQVSR